MDPKFSNARPLEPPEEERCSIAALRGGACILDVIGFASAAHSQERAAFYGGVGEDGLEPLSYANLLEFSRTIGDGLFPSERRGEGPPRLATVIRNSAASAVAFVSLTRRWTLAPLSAAISRGELAFELDDLPAAAVLLDDAVAQAWVRSECDARGIPVFSFRPDGVRAGAFSCGGRRPLSIKLSRRANLGTRRRGASKRATSGRRRAPWKAWRSSSTRPGRRPSPSSCR